MYARVSDLMTTKLVVLGESEAVDLAEGLMAFSRVRHIPVVKDGKPVGLVTHRDLLRAQGELLDYMARGADVKLNKVQVAQCMTRNPRTVSPDDSAAECARVMYENKFGCMLVVDESERLVGIITEADFLKLAFEPWANNRKRAGGAGL